MDITKSTGNREQGGSPDPRLGGSLSGQERAFRFLLIVNALASAAAAIVLTVAPAAIPSIIGSSIGPEAYFVARLLAAAELSLAAMCAYAVQRRSDDVYQQCAVALIVLHVGSIAAGLVQFAAHSNAVVGANIAVRAVIVLLLLTLRPKSRN